MGAWVFFWDTFLQSEVVPCKFLFLLAKSPIMVLALSVQMFFPPVSCKGSCFLPGFLLASWCSSHPEQSPCWVVHCTKQLLQKTLLVRGDQPHGERSSISVQGQTLLMLTLSRHISSHEITFLPGSHSGFPTIKVQQQCFVWHHCNLYQRSRQKNFIRS